MKLIILLGSIYMLSACAEGNRQPAMDNSAPSPPRVEISNCVKSALVITVEFPDHIVRSADMWPCSNGCMSFEETADTTNKFVVCETP